MLGAVEILRAGLQAEKVLAKSQQRAVEILRAEITLVDSLRAEIVLAESQQRAQILLVKSQHPPSRRAVEILGALFLINYS